MLHVVSSGSDPIPSLPFQPQLPITLRKMESHQKITSSTFSITYCPLQSVPLLCIVPAVTMDTTLLLNNNNTVCSLDLILSYLRTFLH